MSLNFCPQMSGPCAQIAEIESASMGRKSAGTSHPVSAHKRVLKRLQGQRRRARLYAQGLTSRKTPRVYTLHPEWAGKPGRTQQRLRSQLLTQQRRAAGLTSRGTKPKWLAVESPVAQRYRDWRAAQAISVPEILTTNWEARNA